MRASWTDLRNSLMFSIGTRNANRQFEAIAMGSKLLDRYSTPGELIEYLVGPSRELDNKDQIYTFLAAAVQRGNRESKLATTIMCLGLCPGLEHIYSKLVRTGVLPVDEAATDVMSVFVLVANRVDLDCTRMAATLVLNTERDVRKAAKCLPTEGFDEDNESAPRHPAPDFADDGSILDDPEALRAWTKRSAGRDGELIALVLFDRLDRHAAADRLGLNRETARKRVRQTLAKIQAQSRELVASHGRMADALRVMESLGRALVELKRGMATSTSSHNRDRNREPLRLREMVKADVDSWSIGRRAVGWTLDRVPGAANDVATGAVASARSIDDVAASRDGGISGSEIDIGNVAFIPFRVFEAAFEECQMNIVPKTKSNQLACLAADATEGESGQARCGCPETQAEGIVSGRAPAGLRIGCDRSALVRPSDEVIRDLPAAQSGVSKIDIRDDAFCPIHALGTAFTQHEEVRCHAKPQNANPSTLVVANEQSIGADSSVGTGNQGDFQEPHDDEVAPFGVAKLRVPRDGMSAGASGPKGSLPIQSCSVTVMDVNASVVLKGGGCEFKGNRAKRTLRRGDGVVWRGNEEVRLLANSEVAIALYGRDDSSTSKGSRS